MTLTKTVIEVVMLTMSSTQTLASDIHDSHRTYEDCTRPPATIIIIATALSLLSRAKQQRQDSSSILSLAPFFIPSPGPS